MVLPGKKRTIRLLLPVVAMVLFFALAFMSFNIQRHDCKNQVLWLNTTGNDTQVDNTISCVTTEYVSEPLAYSMIFLGVFSIFVTFFRLTNKLSGPEADNE
jgi:hypothetical protein